MTALNKQALREAAEKALPAMKRLLMMPNDELFDEALLNVDGDVDAANAFNLLTGPETVLALLDELESAEKRIAELEALASGMEKEPVLYAAKETLAYAKMGELHLKCLSHPMGDAVIPLYAAPQLPQPAPEEIAMQNFRAAMEGIGHIRRTLEEAFGGLHGTHCEPDVLVECKEICDAIHEAYRNSAPVTPDGWQLVPKEPTAAMNKAGWNAINEHDEINPTYRAMLAAAPQQEVKHG